MNNIPGTAFIKDEQGHYLYTNPGAEKLVNCQPQEMIGKTDFDLLPPDVAQKIRENDWAVIAADEPREMVETLPQEDGLHYWLSLKFPFKDASGNQRVAGMSFDISDRQRAENQIAALNKDLNRRVNELQTLLDVIPMGIGIALEADCRDIRINPAFAEWLQLPSHANGSTSQPNAEQLPYRVYRQGQELLPQAQPIQYAAAHGVHVENVELEIVRDDGRILYLLANAAPLFDEEGQVRGCVGAFLDISDRKQAEDSLRASENLYRTLSEAVPDFIWSCNAQGQLDFVNSRWLEYAGMTVEQMNAGGLEQVYHPEDLSRVMQRWNRSIQQREPFATECRYRGKDGLYRWFMVRALPLKDAQGNILKWIGVTTDIHERKQTEEALSQSEERLRVALKNSPISVFNQDRELRYTWKYGSDLENEVEDILGKHDIDLVTPADAEILTQIKRQVLETGIGTRQEVKITLQGQDSYYDLTVEPLQDTKHQVIGITCAAIDISERKQAEQALRESESLFRQMADGTPVFIWMSGLDGHCTYFNQPWLDFVGQTLEEALALGWPDGIHPDDQEYCLETYRSAFNARQR